MAAPEIHIEIDPDVFLPVYLHTLESTNNVEFFYGSRDSGKSTYIAQRLVLKCLANPHFKCALIRKVVNTVKDSQWAMIKSVAEDWKVDHLFKFLKSPLEIHCVNGGQFLARGMDDPKKIKSLTNPSDAWIEEGADLEEEDWIIITTSLRSNDAKAQIWFSFNPDVEGLYQEHWLYKRYFSHTPELSFNSVIDTQLMDGSNAQLSYRATHSTFYDNPYCPAERRAVYEDLIKTSEYFYQVYARGQWGTKQTGGEFYRSFRVDKHVRVVSYDPEATIHISIDANVYPYLAMEAFQMNRTDSGGWLIKQIDEMPAIDPENTASRAGQLLVRWLKAHNYSGAVYLYGDRSTKSRNVVDDNKRSIFQIIQEQISVAGYRTVDKFLSYAPSPHSISEFINAIFSGEIPDMEIQIGKNCTKSIGDYIQTKTDNDGNMAKIMMPHPTIEGVKYQKVGHFSDNLKDFMVQAFTKEYTDFTNRHKTLRIGGISQVSRGSRHTL